MPAPCEAAGGGQIARKARACLRASVPHRVEGRLAHCTEIIMGEVVRRTCAVGAA